MFEDPSFISLFLHVFSIPFYDLLSDQTLQLRFLLIVFPLKDSVISIFYQVMLKIIQGIYYPVLKLHQELFVFSPLIFGKSCFLVIITI